MAAQTSMGGAPGPGLRAASQLLARPWTLLIVAVIAAGPCRFTELAVTLDGISTNLLTDRLKMLTAAGLIERGDHGREVVYSLSDSGAGLRPALTHLEQWGRTLTKM